MTDVLLYGAPDALPDLFHVVPAGIVDPFLYVETDGRRIGVVNVLDADNARATGIEVVDPISFGTDDLLAEGLRPHEIAAEVSLRAARELGVTSAVVPFEFPLGIADHLRAGGIELTVDPATFIDRRREKTETELAGIRRAQKAADAAMAVAAELIREARFGLTAEAVREAMRATCDERGCDLPGDVIVAVGGQAAVGHESGSGPITAGDPVVVDIWPRDRASRCWADMTRSFVAGGTAPDGEIQGYWDMTRASLERIYPMVRAGASGREIYEASCEPFIAGGQPTQLTKQPGERLDQGYFHGLGHGVGLEVHERPGLGRAGDELRTGDVITLEPGCYRRGFGGVRLEDLVLVTDGGCEILTDFPYDL